MVVFIPKAFSLESMSLELVVVESANGVYVGSCCQLFKEFLGVVEFENFLDAVEVFSDVVLVLVDTQCFVDLPLHLLIYY